MITALYHHIIIIASQMPRLQKHTHTHVKGQDRTPVLVCWQRYVWSWDYIHMFEVDAFALAFLHPFNANGVHALPYKKYIQVRTYVCTCFMI